MSKLRNFLSSFALTTPLAIILGSLIIAASIVAYGFIVRPTAQKVRDFVKEISKDLGLKGDEWEQCLTSETTLERISEDYNDGIAAGVTGTPSTFILKKVNGKYETVAQIEGAQDENYVRTAIEQALSSGTKTTPFAGKQPEADEFIQGIQNDVLVVEYADAECPFCIRFHPTISKVMDEYKDKAGFVFRHFPLTNLHPNALPYALAIECAGIQKGKDAYFSFIDKLFTEQANP